MMAIKLVAVACVLACLCVCTHGMTIQELAKTFDDVDVYYENNPISTTDPASYIKLIEKMNLEAIRAGLSPFERLYVTFFLVHLEKKIIHANGGTIDRLDLETLLSPLIDLNFDSHDVETINQTLCDDMSLMDLGGVEVLEEEPARRKRKASSELSRMWPDSTVNFFVSPEINESAPFRAAVDIAIAHWESKTCLRFVEDAEDTGSGSRIVFRQFAGCFSYVGMKDYPQIISLGPNCGSFPGFVIKLLGNAIGFWEEHQRPDRDDYVQVVPSKIKIGNWNLFVKRGWSDIRLYGIPYDYGSIYHYSVNRFSTDGEATLLPLDMDFISTIGPKDGLSFYDTKLANYHYCQASCEDGLTDVSCANDGYKDPNDCSKCICPDGLKGDCTVPADGSADVECGENNLIATDSPKTIESPGFGVQAYSSMDSCSWLITAKGENSRVRITLNSVNLACFPLCRDYLEVRTNGIAKSGPRFCCPTADGKVFISSSNQVLINYRALQNAASANQGFQLTYIEEVCGGCGLSASPCLTDESYTCTFYYQTTCTSGDPPVTNACQKSRNSTCYRRQPTCCPGFRLDGDVCVTDVEVSEWTEWTKCSKDCGGCGMQSRNRDCLIASCSEPLMEERACAPEKCTEPVTETTYTTTVQTTCAGWWGEVSCLKVVTKSRPNFCCPGYEESEGQCVFPAVA